MKIVKKIIGLSLIAFLLFVACSKNDDVEQIKSQQLKFEKNIDKKTQSIKKSTNNSNFSTYTIKLDSSGKLMIDEDNLIISEAINRENGVKSYVITEKKKSNLTTLKTLSLSAKANSESDGGGSYERGYWYNGHDCFIYGTIFIAADGTRSFVAADAATQVLMNSCGWGNVG